MNTARASTSRKLNTALGIVAKGFCMGAADVVPGVSGGTMAFVLGIYTRFIDAIKSFDLVWLRACLRLDWRIALGRPDFAFIVPLGVGIAAALVFFTRIIPIPQLLTSAPEQIYAVFFGLIVGSIVTLLRGFPHKTWRDLVPFVAGVAMAAIIVTAVPAHTPDTWWFVLLAGALAICAMVVPGISGSFVLLLLGKYAYVLDAIGHFQLAVIVPFASGAAIGLFAFSRILSWVLHHYERRSLFAIMGVLVASLWVIWPYQTRTYVTVRGKARLIESAPCLPDLDSGVLNIVLLMAAGLILVLFLDRLASAGDRAKH